MNLQACLEASSWRNLCAVARYHKLPVRSATSKIALIFLLHHHLSGHVTPSVLAAALDSPHGIALHALARAGGNLPSREFAALHGPLRLAYAQGGDPRRLIGADLSAAETLLLSGLIFEMGQDRRPGTRRIILPDEWLAHLTPTPEPATQLSDSPMSQPIDIPTTLALLVAYLSAERPRVLTGPQFAARHTRHLTRCLHLSSISVIAPVSFLLDLATQLDLVAAIDGHWQPTLQASVWFAAATTEQWRAIGRCLTDPPAPDSAPWRSFRAAHLPQAVSILQRLVAQLRPNPAPPSIHLRQIHLDDLIPWWDRDTKPDTAYQQAHALVSGPLTWLGILQPSPSSPDLWQLTSRGAWLLGHTDPPDIDPTGPFQLNPDLTLTLPPTPNLPAILALGPWVELQPTLPDATALPTLALTQHSVQRALQTGRALTDLFHLLNHNATPPLTSDQAHHLESWLPTEPTLTLRPAWLLTATNPAQLTTALANPHLRPHLTHRLTPQVAELMPQPGVNLPRLTRRLGLMAPSQPAAKPAGASPEALGWLITALMSLTHLAQRLHQPTPPPSLITRLTDQAGPTIEATARLQADLLCRHLDTLLADDPPILPAPVDAHLDRIQQALDLNRPLRITYWTLGRPRPRARRVQPLRLEWRGDMAYLIAHCHTRQAERTFRLDRILTIDDTPALPRSPDAPPSWSPPLPHPPPPSAHNSDITDSTEPDPHPP